MSLLRLRTKLILLGIFLFVGGVVLSTYAQIPKSKTLKPSPEAPGKPGFARKNCLDCHNF